MKVPMQVDGVYASVDWDSVVWARSIHRLLLDPSPESHQTVMEWMAEGCGCGRPERHSVDVAQAMEIVLILAALLHKDGILGPQHQFPERMAQLSDIGVHPPARNGGHHA